MIPLNILLAFQKNNNLLLYYHNLSNQPASQSASPPALTMSILSVGYLYAPIVPTILSCIIVTLVGSLIQMCIKNPRPTVHILNPMESFEFSRQRVLKIYYQTAHESLQTWFRQHPDRAVALHAESGPLTILPASMADEIRRDKRLNLNKIFDVVGTRSFLYIELPMSVNWANF